MRYRYQTIIFYFTCNQTASSFRNNRFVAKQNESVMAESKHWRTRGLVVPFFRPRFAGFGLRAD
jgi:hypothetical protein